MDFVIAPRGRPPVAIECKWSVASFDTASLGPFLRQYPRAEAFVVAHDVARAFTRSHADHPIRFVSLDGLIDHLIGRQA